MHYIVLDLEFNQDFPSLDNPDFKRRRSVFEIIQIGAIKLDENFNTIASFNRYVKPTIYSKVSPFITKLTGITTEQVMNEKEFPEVYEDFLQFIEDKESIFCTWGMSDMKELFKNLGYHKLDNKSLSRSYINLQPYVSKFLGLPSKKLLSLQNAVKALNIEISYEFHSAIHDAYYTAEIFKKIYDPSIVAKLYDPYYVKPKPKPRKRKIDYKGLINQFEKMYDRDLTKEEKDMIILAYKMGKTNQFLK